MVGESSRTTCITREADRTCNCSSCLFFKRVFVFFKFEHFETRPWNMMELGFQPSAGGRESAEVWWSGSGCPIAPPWAMVVSTVFSGPRTGNGPSRRPKPMILGAYAVRDGPLGQLLFQANHAEGTRGESKKTHLKLGDHQKTRKILFQKSRLVCWYPAKSLRGCIV